jgi:hypothetical protein
VAAITTGLLPMFCRKKRHDVAQRRPNLGSVGRWLSSTRHKAAAASECDG